MYALDITRAIRVILVGALVLLVLLLRASSADANQATAAVIGGQPGSIPQLARVDWTDAQGGGLCTGTLVAPNAILTAAHCANGPPGSYQVTLPSTAALPVTAVVIDPGYSPAADYNDDAAVLVLARPVNVLALPLAVSEPAAGTSATFYGWGGTDTNGTLPAVAQTAQTVIQSDAYCQSIWGSGWAATDLCALDYPYDDVSIAGGDSGGPLVANGAEVGISDRTANNTAVPSVFTRVDTVYGWIQSVLKANPPRYPALPPRYRVPRLRGRTIGQARRLLSSAYLALGRVHRVGWGVGIVRQSPAGGSWQRAGTRVAVWVA